MQTTLSQMLLLEPFCPGWEPLGPSWVGAKEKGWRSKSLGSWGWDGGEKWSCLSVVWVWVHLGPFPAVWQSLQKTMGLKIEGCCSSSFEPFHCWGPPSIQFSCLVISNSVTPQTAACQAFLSITSSWSLLKLTSIELVMPSNHLILCHLLLLLPSIFPSIRVFSKESVLWIFKWVSSLHQVAEVLEFELQHQSFQWTVRADFL